MSERTAGMGIKGPPKTIEHNGKTYTIAPVLTEGTLARIESHMYQKARQALVELKDDYPEAAYVAELNALRKRREEGAFMFENCADLLDNIDGAALMLGFMMDATRAEVIDLLMSKPAEMEEIMSEVMADTFPAGTVPKQKAPLPKKGRGKFKRNGKSSRRGR